MSEFDERVDACGVLQNGAVAERPMVATAGSGAGGAHQGSPKDDGDEISKNSPCKATQGGRRKQSCIHGKGGCRHEESLRMELTSVEQGAGCCPGRFEAGTESGIYYVLPGGKTLWRRQERSARKAN